MQRRTFVIRSGGLTLSIFAGVSLGSAIRTAPDRVGLGTVTFRNRFEQTKPKGAQPGNSLRLLDVPAYYRDRFGVRHLEFWSRHFESLEPAYLGGLRDRVRDAGAELINVQVDADYDLASPDEPTRQQSLATVRQWIDAAALLGSRAVRVNPGRTGGSIEKCVASLREVNEYCLAKRLPLLTENHFGIEMDADVHLRILEAVGSDNIHTLPDFGNYPSETMWASLAKILPHAYLVSAKTVNFDAQGQHLSYDFDRCLQLCEDAGFKGLYLVEQWSRKEQPIDAERIADWMLQRTRRFLRLRSGRD
jgi:sugar phosphate isomerase/epimerase